jgi:hypothetical protein
MKVKLEDGTETTLEDMAKAFEAREESRMDIMHKVHGSSVPGEIIKIKGSRYSLERDYDRSGDSGSMLVPFNFNERKEGENGTIQIGCGVKCGSIYARTMQAQDWWMTTPITEIIEKAEDNSWVKFRTKNSVYTVRGF